jgi:hypothetical protein
MIESMETPWVSSTFYFLNNNCRSHHQTPSYRNYADIDVVVDYVDMPTLVKELTILAEQNQIQFVQAFWHEQTACCFVSKQLRPRDGFNAPDVRGDYLATESYS